MGEKSMAIKIVTVMLFLVFCIIESIDAETLSVYSGAKISSTNNEMNLDTITITQEGGELIAYYGHVGLPLDDCEEGWLCLPLPYFEFAVPSSANIDIDQSWVYGETELKVVNNYPQVPTISEERVFAIELTEPEHRKVALVFWQPSRGVIGFSFRHQGVFFSYNLVSPIGMGSARRMQKWSDSGNTPNPQ